MRNPDWFVLMREWVLQNHGDRGVTLPFLIGALAHKRDAPPPSRADAKTLLNQMISNPVDSYVTEIAWCSSLGAPVLTATEAPFRFNSKAGFRHPSRDLLSVVFGTDLQDRWHSSDPSVLLDELLDDAEVAITERRFSRDSRKKAYRNFEPWEEQFIRERLSE